MVKTERLDTLKRACEEAVDLFKPVLGTDGGDTITKCNWSVHAISSKMGFSGFYDMMANQIVDRMTNAPDFAEVSPEAAQNLANDGRLVIAGVKDDPHGHVAVCYPGSTCYSGKWREAAPMTANAGLHNGIKSANYSFGAIKPKYWTWIEETKHDLEANDGLGSAKEGGSV